LLTLLQEVAVTISDWVQILTLFFVAGALILSLWQGRQMLRQTMAMTGDLFNDVSTSLMETHTDQRTTFFLHDPELLAWHLESRGYRSTTPFENKQRLYALVKFDTHESIHLRHARGTIDEPMWNGWLQVLNVDLQVPIFADVWENGRQFYEESFAELVDSILRRRAVEQMGSVTQ
jgi:hypothetical protein